MTTASKIAIIGIDGLSIELFRYIATRPEFAHLKNLFQHSILLELAPYPQLASASSWATLATGVNPGKHGIFGDSKRIPGTYEFVTPNARFRQAPTFWQIAEKYGYKVGIFNAPVSYPPEPVDGFFVAGSEMPGLASPFTYPNGLYLFLTETFGFYKSDVDDSISSKNAYLEDILKLSTHQFEVFEFLLKKYSKVELVFAVFTALDRLLHIFDWSTFLSAPSDTTDHEEDTARRVFFTFFKQLDETLKKITEIDGTFTIILVSPYGQTAIQTQLDLNQWLIETGYLNLNTSPEPTIDWQHTLAYSPGAYGQIYLNRKGREPQGIVEEGREAKEVRARISASLLEKAQTVQSCLIQNILPADALYWGTHVHSAPDLTLELQAGCSVIDTLFLPDFTTNLEGVSLKVTPLFTHSKSGLLVLNNPTAKVQNNKDKAQLHDVGPTILSLLGISIPEWMDGESVLYQLSDQQSYLPPQEFIRNEIPTNVEILQQLVNTLEESLQLRQAELKVQQHNLALEKEVTHLQKQVANLTQEVHLLRSGRVMRLMLWGGNLYTRLKKGWPNEIHRRAGHS